MKRGTSIQALDPGTKAWAEGATRNRAARTRKQVNDSRRIRIKIECNDTLKRILAEAAADLGTSTSQLGSYLLTQGLITYLRDNPDIPVTPSRSPRIIANIVRSDLEKRLAEAHRASSARTNQDNGANDGATVGANEHPT